MDLAHTWQGPADGPVTLVLHGGGPGCHSASDFAALLPLRPGHRHLLVDLPRYGASGPWDDDGPLFSAHARVLAALLDRLDTGPVDVLAQSLGGGVALRLAAGAPERVRRLVVIGATPATGPGIDAAAGGRARAGFYADPSRERMHDLVAGLEWYDGTAVPDSLVEARYRAATTPVALATAFGGRGAPEDLGPLLHRVQAPTLVVHGEHDPFATPEYAAYLADALPAGELAVVARTAHHPQSERPAAVAALADAFLTPHPGAVPCAQP